MTSISDGSEFSAWNPGLESSIPSELEPLVTLYRPGNSTVDYKQAKELSDFCGLGTAELISFTVERLIVHELLVRVTSDLSVPDGPNYEDLGISLRGMISTIYDRHISREIGQVQIAYDALMTKAHQFIEQQLSEQLFPAVRQNPQAQKKSILGKLFFKKAARKKATKNVDSRPGQLTAIAYWQELLSAGKKQHENEVSAQVNYQDHCLAALVKVTNSITALHGRVVNDPQLIAMITCNYASNQIGRDVVAELIDPLFDLAVKAEGYRVLPYQQKPVVMNVKGASASGKSTIRPRQQQLAEQLGIEWRDFALISPDYWRKYLLAYETLGEHYKYGAMLTGQELVIIDKKLDRYMASKAEKKKIPHLLIDRFRFDSFSVDGSEDSQLLSRFGDRIFLFFMITPLAETVLRAWERGKSTGRYKSVDDLLYHNIEAFTGMPALFLSWVGSTDKRVHFEFLDNSVEKGQLPKTAAFGWNDSMTILDIALMRDIDRFRRVNVDATCEDEVLQVVEGTDKNTTEFISHCINKISRIRFADADTTQIIAECQQGDLIWFEEPDSSRRASVEALLRNHSLPNSIISNAEPETVDLAYEKKYTLGQWGAAAG